MKTADLNMEELRNEDLFSKFLHHIPPDSKRIVNIVKRDITSLNDDQFQELRVDLKTQRVHLHFPFLPDSENYRLRVVLDMTYPISKPTFFVIKISQHTPFRDLPHYFIRKSIERYIPEDVTLLESMITERKQSKTLQYFQLSWTSKSNFDNIYELLRSLQLFR